MTREIRVEYQVDPAEGYDLLDVGKKIAQEQSVGGYRWEFDREFDVDDHRATVRDPDLSKGTVTVGYPTENIAPELPHLLNYVAGDVFGSTYVDKIKLLDVRFPPSFVEAFPGPQFGVEGIRDRLAVGDRPLLGMILKPSLGLSPDRIGDIVRCAGEAGVDLIKEDEKLVDPTYCSFEDRLDQVVSALRHLEDATDDQVLYVLNVTEREEAFLDYIERNDISDVLDRFVYLVTVISHGFGQLQTLVEDDRFDGPVYAHRGGHAAYTRTDHGIAMRVLEKLSRLAGADFGHCGTVSGSHERRRSEVIQNRTALVTNNHPWEDVGRTLPVVSGGVNPRNIAENMRNISYEDIERDLAFVIGSGIYAHSGGTLSGIAEGIQANQEAIRAATEGYTVGDVLDPTTSGYEAMREWLKTEQRS